MRILVCLILAHILLFSAVAVAQTMQDPSSELNNLGVKEIEKGDNARGVQLLQEAVRRDPKNAKAYFNLGTALYLLGELAKAQLAFSRALELEPHSAAVLNQLAVTQMELGDNSGAARNLRSAVTVRPDDVVALYNLGCLYIRLKDFGSAVDPLERAMVLDNKNPEIRFNLAFAFGRIGNITKAIDQATATLGLSPDDRDARQMLIVLRLINRERTAALTELQQLQRSGLPVDAWLLNLVYGKRVVSVKDLRNRDNKDRQREN